MNIEHLRRALKSEWLTYYRSNRDWIIKLGVWVNCQGQRRPSSSFILGVLSSLEPQLTQLLPLVVDLNCNPDRIVAALGLNFNPEDELAALEELESPPTRPRPITRTQTETEPVHAAPKLLPSSSAPIASAGAIPAASGQTGPDFQSAPLVNPFVQSAQFENSQREGSRSKQAQPEQAQSESAQSDQNQSDQAQAVEFKSEPSSQLPKPSRPSSTPRTVAPSARRTLDTAQLNARELPDRDTSTRRSRNRRS